MRMKALLWGDIRFQFKYGFYFLYFVFSVLYVGLLLALPASFRETAGILLIFTDPAAMGLYFMGAIVLFEKSERVLSSIAVSPVKPTEYVLSKLISIAVISVAVGLVIALAGGEIPNLAFLIMGLFFGSCLFSSVGLIVACRITTLNQFVIATVPAEIFINIPAIAYLFGYKKGWLILHPGVCIMELFEGGGQALPAVLILAGWTVGCALLARAAVKKMLKSVGGIKL